MERDSTGGQDVGRDLERDLGDEPPASIRDAAPDYPLADRRILPGLRAHPAARIRRVGDRFARARLGTRQGPDLPGLPTDRHPGPGDRRVRPRSARRPGRHEPRPADARPGPRRPAGRLHARRRRLRHRRQRRAPDVVGRDAVEIQDAAMRNLSRWSATAPWTDEVSGDRRLVSSDTGHGWDAARILLPEVDGPSRDANWGRMGASSSVCRSGTC